MVTSSALAKVPTNIITGFLGVGKTTAIQHLLRDKPVDEKWAVLVNEFGEVGIDASLVSGNHSQESGVYLREVPGGCMCCASGLPMQIALNMLLQVAKPDRLLIEPTGLGHPEEVLSILSNQYYRDVLTLHATITLVDARKLSNEQYTSHPIFQQQLAIADVLVANKADLYQAADRELLARYCADHPQLLVQVVEQGRLDFDWLQYACAFPPQKRENETPAKAFVTTTFAPRLPECGYLRVNNHGQGFNSSGWLFDADYLFDDKALHQLLDRLQAVRIKGVFITSEGVIGFNKVDGLLSRVELDDAADSRIELIASDLRALDDLEQALLGCVTLGKVAS